MKTRIYKTERKLNEFIQRLSQEDLGYPITQVNYMKINHLYNISIFVGTKLVAFLKDDMRLTHYEDFKALIAEQLTPRVPQW